MKKEMANEPNHSMLNGITICCSSAEACKYTIYGAILLQYLRLSYSNHPVTKIINGKEYFEENMKAAKEFYPFMTKANFEKGLMALEREGAIERIHDPHEFSRKYYYRLLED